MAKKKIFISSVQTEFSKERRALHEYISSDPLLGKFFEPFLFELLPAIDQRADEIYLQEVERSDIYYCTRLFQQIRFWQNRCI